MNIPFVDLKAQYKSLKLEIDTAIQHVLNDSAFIGGEYVLKFEELFEQEYGVDYFVPCANGTDALYIAMKMLDIGEGDEVITTASSWISTSETVTQTGADPIFIDVDQFYTIDAAKIEEKITSRTKAIIPVHLYGQMADMEKIMSIARKYNLYVIEDCAQSHMSELKGLRAGLWGDIATFSFYPGKNLGAYGDAGGIITNNRDLAMRCRRFANHGALTKHNHEVEGINSRLDAIQAAILSVKLPYLNQWTQDRIRVGSRYIELLKEVPEITLPEIRPESLHSFHVFPIKIDDREKLKKALETQGIPTQIHYPKAMPFMLAYKRYNAKPQDFPNSYDLQEKELSLPIYPEMSDAMINYVCNKIIEYYAG